LSATAFLGTHGFITADYEYVDYSAASFSFDPADATAQTVSNQQIKQLLQPASNVRVGIEVRVTNFFSLRGGYSYMGSPYASSSGINTASNTFSGGIGFRFDHWYLDAAFAHTMYNGIDQPYPSDPSYAAVPVATLGNSLNNASMTVGFRF
jgi:long-subunit fatty acid transport protein